MSYSDEIKKIEYYKQRIIDRYLQDNQIINNNRLQQYLDSIDMKISIFRQGFIENGEKMNLDKFNSQKADIYEDLRILYELIYEFAQNRLSKLEAKIKCSLENLNQTTQYFQNRTKLESLSVYGNTLYYKTNGFSQIFNNGKVYIDIGSLSVPSGSYLVCLLDSNEIENSDVIFKFDDDNQISDYMYNRNYLKVPGNYKINTYNYETEEAPTEAFEINVDNLNPDQDKKYNVFAGRNKIKIVDAANYVPSYIDKTSNIGYQAETSQEISFYVYNASYISFSLIGDYDYKSFEGNEITSPKQRQKILLKVKPGFTFDFVTDGEVYADKGSTYIEDEKLYSVQSFSNISDYMIEEIAFGDPVQFEDVRVIIDNAASTFYDINYIAVKQAQISELDGEYEL